MPERVWGDDPTIPPPGQRTGAGSASILPYLVRTLAAKPKACPSQVDDQRPMGREQAQDTQRPN